jgi:Ca2+-binding RTX toxin-like protein
MKVSLLLLTIAVLSLGRTELAAAQANCPSTNNIQFINGITGAKVTTATLSNKIANIEIGAVPFLSGYTNMAFIRLNNGSCAPHWLSYDGTNVATMLTKHTNLCLGYRDDVVDNIVDTHPPFSCGGQTYDPEPMLYNGYRFNIYSGSGNDVIWGNYGTDRIYGGAGDDNLNDGYGEGDRMYGETNNDELYCSPGDNTICDGGGAPDYIEDDAGWTDSLYGGGSSDEIWSCGDWTTIDCGESSPGYSDSDIAYSYPGATHTNCETVSTPNPFCF